MAVTITSTQPSVVSVGIPVPFTVCTTAGVEVGTIVRALITLTNPAQSQQFSLVYLPPSGPPNPIVFNASGQATFGPSTGFPLANTCSNFEITYFAPGVYSSTTQIIDVNTGQVLATLSTTTQAF